eukprot:1213351-Pyramimonas_sp.AAC.1
MSGRRKPGDVGWEVWRPAALTRVRTIFCDGGFPSAVQMLCWKSWGMMRSTRAIFTIFGGGQGGKDGG